MTKEEIQNEIDRLETLMCKIFLSKKTDYVLKNQAKLKKLRRMLKQC